MCSIMMSFHWPLVNKNGFIYALIWYVPKITFLWEKITKLSITWKFFLMASFVRLGNLMAHNIRLYRSTRVTKQVLSWPRLDGINSPMAKLLALINFIWSIFNGLFNPKGTASFLLSSNESLISKKQVYRLFSATNTQNYSKIRWHHGHTMLKLNRLKNFSSWFV